MEEFATSSVETGKYQCLEDGVEPPTICTLKTWEAAAEAGATNYATLEGGDNPSEHFPKDLGFA
jgi:hypothetical protein